MSVMGLTGLTCVRVGVPSAPSGCSFHCFYMHCGCYQFADNDAYAHCEELQGDSLVLF
jgi:hypothetical protein